MSALAVLSQRRQAGGQVNGNDRLSHFTTMGFLAVAGCMLLATAMSAALSSKPSKARWLGGGELGGGPQQIRPASKRGAAQTLAKPRFFCVYKY